MRVRVGVGVRVRVRVRVRVGVSAPLRFDADDADGRVERLDCKGHPRDQPGAAHGYDDRVEVLHLRGGWG